MDTKTFLTVFGQCRCCSEEGNHKDLFKEYWWEGIREVYSDIFEECFNLSLSTKPNLTTLICSKCIDRLRDASTFKSLAVSTEAQLLNATLLKNEKKVKTKRVNNCEKKIKLDCVKQEDKLKTNITTVKVESWILEQRGDAESDSDRTDCEKDDKFEDDEDWPKDKKPPIDKSNNVLEKTAQVTNASILLECSNITPFRSRTHNGFPCFYCRYLCEDLERLKAHTTSHKKSEFRKILSTYRVETLSVNVDITNLSCSLCNAAMPNLNHLKTHLMSVHEKKIYPDFNDRVIPFKLSSKVYECQICGFNFETFGAVERHMNVHFRNYVCKDCGTGFVTKYRLKVHVKSMHVEGSCPCEICKKVFTTPQKLKNHVDAVHKNVKRFKCMKCPEKFSEYFRRQKHMVEKHGVAPLQYKCNVCDKSFERRYILSNHMKRDHLEEKNYQCDLCAYRCFTRSELRFHTIKHTGQRIHECTVCKKSYARKKTLTEHMRIHNNDRRFVCPVCGQAFVQKCSLKGHLKTHHNEISMQ